MVLATWMDLGAIVVTGVLAYAAVVLILRMSGRRTLSQLNAFDFIVTVALGSTLATTILNDTVSVAEGSLAIALLVALQALVAYLVTRRPSSRTAVTARPLLIVNDGVIDEDAARTGRLSRSDIMQAVRSSGAGDIALVGAVVLETNGSMSVITSDKMGSRSALDSFANR